MPFVLHSSDSLDLQHDACDLALEVNVLERLFVPEQRQGYQKTMHSGEDNSGLVVRHRSEALVLLFVKLNMIHHSIRLKRADYQIIVLRTIALVSRQLPQLLKRADPKTGKNTSVGRHMRRPTLTGLKATFSFYKTEIPLQWRRHMCHPTLTSLKSVNGDSVFSSSCSGLIWRLISISANGSRLAHASC